jgi:hypothetical protein
MKGKQNVPVERTLRRHARSVEHVGANHRRRNVFVTEELLNGPDVVVGLKEMGGKSVPKAMDTDGFAYVREAYGGVDRCLEVALVDMVASYLAGAGVFRQDLCKEDILPPEFDTTLAFGYFFSRAKGR